MRLRASSSTSPPPSWPVRRPTTPSHGSAPDDVDGPARTSIWRVSPASSASSAGLKRKAHDPRSSIDLAPMLTLRSASDDPDRARNIFSALDVIFFMVFPVRLSLPLVIVIGLMMVFEALCDVCRLLPSALARASRSLPISAPRLTSPIPLSTPVEYPILRSFYARQVDRPPTARIPCPTSLSLHPPPFHLPPPFPAPPPPPPVPAPHFPLHSLYLPPSSPPIPTCSSSLLLFPLPPQTKLTPKEKLPLRPPLSELYSNALLSTLNARVRLGAGRWRCLLGLVCPLTPSYVNAEEGEGAVGLVFEDMALAEGTSNGGEMEGETIRRRARGAEGEEGDITEAGAGMGSFMLCSGVSLVSSSPPLAAPQTLTPPQGSSTSTAARVLDP
ncbi:hypothetical protein B0H13DRAFT_2358188 [Mycena leptocephala]|nr:hypothetical protein B0H13DRAFT_2358188 [Mycena leptocephala]